MPSDRQAVRTAAAPAAIGPYSQAISVPAGGRLVFCSGQIALSPESGQLVGAGDVREQTEQVLRNLRAVLEAAGAGPEHVVKTTIFLQDLGDFAAVNELYGRLFTEAPPARSTVQAAGLPRGALVEIEAVAVVP
jgi:2-iminobutanoate/2-iminopropanoate deaminase